MKKNKSSEVLIQTENITKIFGGGGGDSGFIANDKVSLVIKKGEIHGLVGENGAGKSTLTKMLFGALQPTSGKILFGGKQTVISSPYHARNLGISMVFQHFSVFDSLTVAENIAVFGEANRLGEIRQNTKKISKKYGLPLNPDDLLGELSMGEKQRVEIVRCLIQDPKLLILDEPTSVLTPQESKKLFVTLKKLADEGRSILYITHKLEEVKSICDTATIMRAAKVVGRVNPKKHTPQSLATKMVGTKIKKIQKNKKNTKGAGKNKSDVILKVSMVLGGGDSRLNDVSFEVRGGEILGIAGVAGNGQTELFDMISGETLAEDDSQVVMMGKKCGAQGISFRRKLGAAFVPEQRLGHGAVQSMDLNQNLFLGRHTSDITQLTKKFGLVINKKRTKEITDRVVADMDVRVWNQNPRAGELSGGNLQKFIVGRELDRKPKLLVVNQPTWGVDVAAAAVIHQKIIDLADGGSAVVMISQDLDEIFQISTKIAVIADGKMSEPQDKKRLSLQKVGLMMTTKKINKSKAA